MKYSILLAAAADLQRFTSHLDEYKEKFSNHVNNLLDTYKSEKLKSNDENNQETLTVNLYIDVASIPLTAFFSQLAQANQAKSQDLYVVVVKSSFDSMKLMLSFPNLKIIPFTIENLLNIKFYPYIFMWIRALYPPPQYNIEFNLSCNFVFTTTSMVAMIFCKVLDFKFKSLDCYDDGSATYDSFIKYHYLVGKYIKQSTISKTFELYDAEILKESSCNFEEFVYSLIDIGVPNLFNRTCYLYDHYFKDGIVEGECNMTAFNFYPFYTKVLPIEKVTFNLINPKFFETFGELSEDDFLIPKDNIVRLDVVDILRNLTESARKSILNLMANKNDLVLLEKVNKIDNPILIVNGTSKYFDFDRDIVELHVTELTHLISSFLNSQNSSTVVIFKGHPTTFADNEAIYERLKKSFPNIQTVNSILSTEFLVGLINRPVHFTGFISSSQMTMYGNPNFNVEKMIYSSNINFNNLIDRFSKSMN